MRGGGVLMPKSILSDIRTHASTGKLLLGCVQLMRCCFRRRPVQLDDLAWAHPAPGEVRLRWAGARLPTESGGFGVRLPGVMSINQ